jgi:glycerophosphoryl diester phosphodiesterase
MLYTNISVVPPVIAHRGVSALAPENTMAAFAKAREYGLRWLELDVTVASCGTVVVIHDDDLQRTTNGVGKITDFTYDYLKSLDAGSWFAEEFSNEKIPTLKDVLLFLNQNQMGANIEIKSYPGKEAWLVKRVLEDIKIYANHDTPLLMSSFSKTVLKQVRHQDTHIPLGFLMSEWDENYHDFCNEISATHICIEHHLLFSERVKQLKSGGRFVFAYTVNEVARAKVLFAFGVDAVFSDCSREILSELGFF